MDDPRPAGRSSEASVVPASTTACSGPRAAPAPSRDEQHQRHPQQVGPVEVGQVDEALLPLGPRRVLGDRGAWYQQAVVAHPEHLVGRRAAGRPRPRSAAAAASRARRRASSPTPARRSAPARAGPGRSAPRRTPTTPSKTRLVAFAADAGVARPRGLTRGAPATSTPSSTTAGRDRPAPNRFRARRWRSRGQAGCAMYTSAPAGSSSARRPRRPGAYSRPVPSIANTTPTTLSVRASASATYSSCTETADPAAQRDEVGPHRGRVGLDPLALVEHGPVARQQVSHGAQHDQAVVGDPAALPGAPAEQPGDDHARSPRG